nr:hypothetical protein [Tanacetum cinerariifolium]
IVAKTYPDFTSRQSDDDYLKEREILTPRNDDADAINENMFKKLRGAPVTYNSADEICKASTDTIDQHNLYPVLRDEVDVAKIALRQQKDVGGKIMGLNQRIEDTEGEIRTFECHLDIMDTAINSE